MQERKKPLGIISEFIDAGNTNKLENNYENISYKQYYINSSG